MSSATSKPFALTLPVALPVALFAALLAALLASCAGRSEHPRDDTRFEVRVTNADDVVLHGVAIVLRGEPYVLGDIDPGQTAQAWVPHPATGALYLTSPDYAPDGGQLDLELAVAAAAESGAPPLRLIEVSLSRQRGVPSFHFANHDVQRDG